MQINWLVSIWWEALVVNGLSGINWRSPAKGMHNIDCILSNSANKTILWRHHFVSYFRFDVIILFHIFIIFYLGIRDRHQILCLTLSKFSKINLFLFPLKSLENLWFSNDFRGIRSLVIQLMLEAKFGDDPLCHA